MTCRRPKRVWGLIRVVTALCALCLLLSQCLTWVRISVLRAESERLYREDLFHRQQTCRRAEFVLHRGTTTTTTTTSSKSSSSRNSNNSSSSFPKLFFQTCRVDLNLNPNDPLSPTPPQPPPSAYYRLGLPTNFTCAEEESNSLLTQKPGENTARCASAAHSIEKTTTATATTFTKPTHIPADDDGARQAGDADRDQGKGGGALRYHSCLGHTLVPADSPVPAVPFGQPCLKRFVEESCHDDVGDSGLLVPRLVHYVWFSRHPLDLVTFLSVLAAYRFLDPCLILFHADTVPEGPYWRALASLVPVLVVVRREAPAQVFGRPLGAVQHKSDIARLEALKEYGGIYLDGDQVVLRSLDEFRGKEFVMGHENARNLANSLLVSAPHARFIDIWYRNYRSYNPRQWGIHSTFLPHTLARLYPHLIHNAGYAFVRPDLPDIREVWEGHYHWAPNHAVHLYFRSMLEGRQVRTDYTLHELLALNSSLGEIARHVVFGSKDACFSSG
ncbi:uncharacterized protein LOC143284078 [Babylonia areolata]|uniref:uncharacterized protein LOC143284078 n=1 Tax=Babylonia areolata TaxID=304850 RepID=UPI003FCF9819